MTPSVASAHDRAQMPPRMSSLTRCNFCSLRRLIEQHGTQNIKLTGDDELPGWIQVMVFKGPADANRCFQDGWEKSGHAFLELTLTCVC
jgi:hypothetical protein